MTDESRNPATPKTKNWAEVRAQRKWAGGIPDPVTTNRWGRLGISCAACAFTTVNAFCSIGVNQMKSASTPFGMTSDSVSTMNAVPAKVLTWKSSKVWCLVGSCQVKRQVAIEEHALRTDLERVDILATDEVSGSRS